MLFETEDWYDDPDKPKQDPDEVEMQKDLDTQNKKPKKLVRIMGEIEKKIGFFHTEFGKCYENFAKLAVPLDRAYIVFESVVTADIADETKYTHVLTFHAVCQGK